MYHDLDPRQPSFPHSEIVQSLLAGRDLPDPSPFAEEYDVDEPNVEGKVPFLVMDADSSQFSALVDIGEGRNLAIEGPPGTGKSQTIVNAIAAALAEGKKVLFVAEKLAALNVVKSRLEAIGLGEFLLPLQAEKSTREQVIDSIRARLEMRDCHAIHNYDDKLRDFKKVREQLADYIELITTKFGDSELTVHAILSKAIATSERLSGIPQEVLESCRLAEEMKTRHGFSTLVALGAQLEKAHAETLGVEKHWQDTRLIHPYRFAIENACALAQNASVEATRLAEVRDKLACVGLNTNESQAVLKALVPALESAKNHLQCNTKRFLIDILVPWNAEVLSEFLNDCAQYAVTENALAAQLSESPHAGVLDKLRILEDICNRASLQSIDYRKLAEELLKKKKAAETARAIAAAIKPLVSACEAASVWEIDDLAKAHALYKEAGRDVILLKTSHLSAEHAVFHLRKLCEEGRALQQDRDVLAAKVLLSDEIPIDALVECVTVLRTAGPFSFLSARCRNARRLAKSVLRRRNYSRVDAIHTLEKLIAFRRKAVTHMERAMESGLFGVHYRGLDTDYELFNRLARFMERIIEHFSGPSHLTLKTFLLRASPAQLDLLPPLPTTGVSITFSSLGERIAAADKDVKVLEAAIAELKAVGQVFRQLDIDVASVKSARAHLESLLALQAKIDQHGAGRALLGDEFLGHRTDVTRFKALIEWARSVQDVAPQLSAVLAAADPAEALKTINEVLAADARLSSTIAHLSEAAKIDGNMFLRGRSLRDAAAVLARAATDDRGLHTFATFATALHDAAPYGIMPLVEYRLSSGSLKGVGAQVEALAARQLAKAVYTQLGSKLTRFRGAKLDELRALLAEKDREIIQLSRRQLRAKIKASAKPPLGNGVGKKSTWTEMALINHEVSKKQRFISVRDLTQRAGRALAELKPCWMMSPLAVALYLPKEMVKFDLCIIDEASQMPPESAMGALLRCKQAVVVGDTNQLPPTNFFKTIVEDEDADEDHSVLDESILEMANGAFCPARRLRWHYRSRHSGLIKFSNRLVYRDSLIVFPSATESMSRMGIEFKYVGGQYKAGTNPLEAKAIINAVIEFMRTDRERSLGVVTLNQKQRDLILEEFEHVAANNEDVQKYLDTWKVENDGLEEFFIKNLENVQGDERDVIFIGTVYGPEKPGARVMQRFGPINGLAGKRRLNVLFTRAKQKIVTFSSMTAADIQANENTNPGVYMLKRWLEYAPSGVLDSGEQTQREPDSEFEVFVMDQIRAMGCSPVPQVGVAGYFVDIGVRHPEWPHGFILGVECDGATYHSAKSARDRDRLRQEVLEGLGWKLHRIWSTDWFNNPRQEAERLRSVIAERIKSLKAREQEYIQLPKTQPHPGSSQLPQKITRDLFESETSAAEPAIRISAASRHIERRVEVGDTVLVRYLTDDKRTIKVTISSGQSDPSCGIIHYRTPVASAILGAEEGEEVEILVGGHIRPAVVESISKNADAERSASRDVVGNNPDNSARTG